MIRRAKTIDRSLKEYARENSSFLTMLVCLSGCSTEPWRAGEHYRIAPINEEKCAAGGGCSMVTKTWFEQQIIRAFKAGYEARQAEEDSL